MKTIFLSLLVMSASSGAFASTVVRTLDCSGTVKVGSKEVAIKGKITDTKYKDEFGTEYWSTLSLTDVENPKKEFFGNLTSTTTDTDIGVQRDTPRDTDGGGIIYYDLFKDKKTYQQSLSMKGDSVMSMRTGLLVIGSVCTREDIPKGKSCKNPVGQRNYIVNYMYGGSSVVDDNARAYEGRINCKQNSKGTLK